MDQNNDTFLSSKFQQSKCKCTELHHVTWNSL